ncbi:hypothetical protein [Reticulibacter mediterranei]|nr:hypothetical protein [Reticulibacter mediterranei]
MNKDRTTHNIIWLGCALSASAILTSLYPRCCGEEQPSFSDHL